MILKFETPPTLRGWLNVAQYKCITCLQLYEQVRLPQSVRFDAWTCNERGASCVPRVLTPTITMSPELHSQAVADDAS